MSRCTDAALGYISPTQGALLQEGIDALVIVNALRAGRQEHRREPYDDTSR